MYEKQSLYSGWMKLYKKKVGDHWYEILDNHDAVSAVVSDSEGKILLVEQYRPALEQNTLELPAGVLDKVNLTKEQVMCEELKEEAGLEVAPEELKELFHFKPAVGFSNSTVWVYGLNLKDVGAAKRIENDDVFHIHWLKKSEFSKAVKEGRIEDSKTLMAYYYLASKIEE